MSNKVYSDALNARAKTRAAKTATPQTSPIPETNQARNAAGGYSFTVDMWTKLDRFLILGSEGGTYYITEKKLTLDNAKNILACIKADGIRTVYRIVEISNAGRAPKNDPALFALALVIQHGDVESKRAACAGIPSVARIGTHLFHLADYLNGMRGWGRAVRNGFANWYNSKTAMQVAQQITKYANRDNWTHRDILRLAHAKPATPSHDLLFAEAAGKVKDAVAMAEMHAADPSVIDYMAAVHELKAETNAKKAAKLIADYKLPRELVPTQLLKEKIVWDALLPHMGMEAMVRNLATMTRVGVIAPLSDGMRTVVEKMQNVDVVKKSRIHPIKVLTALLTYKAGHGVRGDNIWTPNTKIVSTLDEMFYTTFQNIIPSGKRILVALDVSGSMGYPDIAGVIGLSPRLASAALAMMTMRTEPWYDVVGFTSSRGSHGMSTASGINDLSGLSKIAIHDKMSLAQVEKTISGLSFGRTDCSLPMEWARVNKIPVDGFLVYTDNETYAGARHPSQALKAYREVMGIDAKLCVVGMTATESSIADPNDAGMLDVVGFDTATPTLMADFIRGDF